MASYGLFLIGGILSSFFYKMKCPKTYVIILITFLYSYSSCINYQCGIFAIRVGVNVFDTHDTVNNIVDNFVARLVFIGSYEGVPNVLSFEEKGAIFIMHV